MIRWLPGCPDAKQSIRRGNSSSVEVAWQFIEGRGDGRAIARIPVHRYDPVRYSPKGPGERVMRGYIAGSFLVLLTTSAGAQSQAAPAPPPPLTLTCHVVYDHPRIAADMNIVVDFRTRTANGHSAEIADGYITYKWVEVAEGEPTEYQISIDRYAGTIITSATKVRVFNRVSAFGRGTCARAKERRF